MWILETNPNNEFIRKQGHASTAHCPRCQALKKTTRFQHQQVLQITQVQVPVLFVVDPTSHHHICFFPNPMIWVYAVPSPPNGASAPQATLASLNGVVWEIEGACRVSQKKPSV